MERRWSATAAWYAAVVRGAERGRLRNFRCEARWHWVAKQLQTVEGQQKETSWEHYRVKAAPFFPDIHIHRDNSGFSPDGRVWSLDFEMFGSSRIRVCLKQFFGI